MRRLETKRKQADGLNRYYGCYHCCWSKVDCSRCVIAHIKLVCDKDWAWGEDVDVMQKRRNELAGWQELVHCSTRTNHGCCADFLVNMSASADVLAMAKVEVDLATIPEGKNVR